MANDLISRKALIADLRTAKGLGKIIAETIVRFVEKQPTVEAVHGGCGWCNGDHHTKIMAKAIRCHSNGNMSGYEIKVNYCPNCGADMRGTEE